MEPTLGVISNKGSLIYMKANEKKVIVVAREGIDIERLSRSDGH